MKQIKSVILLLIISLIANVSFSQKVFTSTKSRKALGVYQQSDEYLMAKRYGEAEKILLKALSYDSNYVDALMRLSTIYYKTGKPKKEKNIYLRVLRVRPNYPNVYYNYAFWNMRKGNYGKAITYFKDFQQFEITSKRFILKAQNNIKVCEYRKKWIENPLNIELINVGAGVNTFQSEYWPVLTADDELLFFTRQILEDTTIKQGYGKMNEDIYISSVNGDVWENAIPLPGFLNNRDLNEGAISINPDGTMIYYTVCSEDRNSGIEWCDILYSRLKDGKWQKPIKLGPPINTRMKETQPSISFDGKTLYFSSNRKGGFGEMDLWKSTMNVDGTWARPINLGSEINTEGSDQSPFIHADNKTLYYSTVDKLGMGNSDLYMAKKDTSGKFANVVNLGYPINTNKSEFAIFVNARGNKAFFASRVDGGEGGLDIYSFTLPPQYRPDPVVYLKGKVIDKDTKKLLSANFEVIDLESGNLVVKSISDSKSGRFLVAVPAETNYAINVSKNGYLFYSQYLPIKEVESTAYEHDVSLQPIKIGGITSLRNVFFDLDKFTLKPESKIELAKVIKFMNDNPAVKIELGGHTDNQGAAVYNQKLSENRAKTVKEYLINEGNIIASRISHKGYGLTQPIATNDTEKGRALNRRTELKIVGM